MVVQLLERETLNKEEIAQIFEKVKSWNKRPAWTGSLTRVPSILPPVPTQAAIGPVEIAPVKKTRKAKKTSE